MVMGGGAPELPCTGWGPPNPAKRESAKSRDPYRVRGEGGWGRLTGGLGMGRGRGPQPGSPAQLGERLPVFRLPLRLVLPEHGVGLRAGQKGGPVVFSFKMEKSPTGS